jgi:hypothetical protein
MVAPPDLTEGIESLTYWRDRRQRLAWYRFRARREARVMMLRWDERVRAALLSQSGVPWSTRVSGGVLLARIRLRRWRLRAVAALAATAALTLVVLPLAAIVVLLSHLF